MTSPTAITIEIASRISPESANCSGVGGGKSCGMSAKLTALLEACSRLAKITLNRAWFAAQLQITRVKIALKLSWFFLHLDHGYQYEFILSKSDSHTIRPGRFLWNEKKLEGL